MASSMSLNGRQCFLVNPIGPNEARGRLDKGQIVVCQHQYEKWIRGVEGKVPVSEFCCNMPLHLLCDDGVAFPEPELVNNLRAGEKLHYAVPLPLMRMGPLVVPGSNLVIKWWLFLSMKQGYQHKPLLECLNNWSTRHNNGEVEFDWVNFEITRLEAMKAWLKGYSDSLAFEDAMRLWVGDSMMTIEPAKAKHYASAEGLLLEAYLSGVEPRVTPITGYYSQ